MAKSHGIDDTKERKETSMKKIFLLVLVALLAVALVACGGEPTTEPETTTTEPTTTTTAADTTTIADGGDTTTTEEPDVTDSPAHFAEGVDIMVGEPDYMAIEPFAFNSFPCAFENHHADLDFNWALVIRMIESPECVYEQLIGVNPDLDPTSTSNYVVNNQYKWVVEINGTNYEIERFSCYTFITSGYVRMDLGPDFELEQGTHNYDISLKIYDIDTEKLEFWAWFADPLCGVMEFETPAPEVIVPSTGVGEDVEALATGKLQGISGPAGFSSESYTNLFDGEVRKKLCADDATTPIIFAITEDVLTYQIKGISLVGANDDATYTDRIITKFKVYGASSGEEDAAWDLLCDVDATETYGEVVNYGEHYYEFTKTSEYRYYKIVLEREAGTYQFSEVLLYAEKGSVTTN